MAKNKKIIIGIVCMIAALFLIFVLFIIWVFFGDSIKIKVQTVLKTPAAKSAALKYINEKYGDTPQILEVTPITRARGMILATRYFAGMELTADNYSVMIYYNEDEPIIVDNRQYDEICSAVKEYIFDDKELGISYVIDYFSLDFYQKRESGVHDMTVDTKFTSVYFDGDIEKFFSEANAELSAGVTYEGYSEKHDEYRNILNNKLDGICSLLGKENSYVYIFIHDPSVSLPEVKNKFEYSSRIYRIPRYEKYMELIACGYTSNDCVNVLQTKWYNIDKYTAISSDISPIVSGNDFVFRQVDLSDNTVAYRGVYKNDDRKNENILKIRDIGYDVEFTDRKTNGTNIFLRLDREHYNITDKTIPLLVAEGTGAWQGKRLYTSIGYGPYDSDDCDWYYIDDDNLYLHIEGMYVDSWNAYLTFSDL